ncbi:MAG: uroporphyrinogen-III synthase [Armatimonadetes bacterium]|nr:uroporphyrinogen-III synthase [Armatimonadota bacterium]
MPMKPLLGKRVLVTRAEEQAEALASKLEELGAETVKFPLIRIEPPEDEKPLQEAIDKVLAQGYDWVVFTSVHGVRTFFDRVRQRNFEPKNLSSVKFAVIGPATGKELERFGVQPAAMPEKYTNEGLAEMFERMLKANEQNRPIRFLLWRAYGAREVLARRLRELGAIVEEVCAYRTLPNALSEEQIRDTLKKPVHIVTFTSPSTVRAFFEVLGSERAKQVLSNAAVAVIGPVTEQACKEFGFVPEIVAEVHTIDGLVSAIVSWLESEVR